MQNTLYIILFIIYGAVSLLSIVFFSLRELHMLQLNGYKTLSIHGGWRKTTKDIYFRL